MTKKIKISIFISLLGLVLLVFALWYKHEYSMDIVETTQYNSPNLEPKILIATQGSAFKNRITKNLIEHYQNDSIFIKVMDVSLLSKVNPSEYKVLIIIHTWENWKAPTEVQTFIENSVNFKDKIIVMTTSGQGSFKIKDIDAITGESILENTTLYTNKIIAKTNLLLSN